MRIRFKCSLRLEHYPCKEYDQEVQCLLVNAGDAYTVEETEYEDILYFVSLQSFAEVPSICYEKVSAFCRDGIYICSSN